MEDNNKPIFGNDKDREEFRKQQRAKEITDQNGKEEQPDNEETVYIPEIDSVESTRDHQEPKNIDSNIETTPSMTEKPSLVDRCRVLQDRDTTYVFLFGKPQTGKTAITSALCYHMGVDEEGNLNLRDDADRMGRNMLKEMLTKPNSGTFLGRSDRKTITQIDLRYVPSRKPSTSAHFTFIEMSGEDLAQFEHVDDHGRRSGLPDSIHDFLRCPDLDLVFMLVVEHEKAAQDDQFLKEFLDFVQDKRENNQQLKILLLVTKWDTYKGKHKQDVEGFIRNAMPLTFSSLRHFQQTITHFSVGQVIDDELLKFKHDRARSVKHWLYEAVTGKPFPGTRKPWLERLFDKYLKIG